jgi:ACS family tartrate transporter-like MFS transporter
VLIAPRMAVKATLLMMQENNAALYRRISLHIAPPLILLYFIAFLDRVNISFAALTMNRDLGIGDNLFGFAAGIFFIGYLLFAVPSNLMLARFGARRWIAVLMVVWGLLSGSMAYVHGAPMYLVLRFLIGAAEAGFFPGIILYLTLWLPASARAGIMALFTFAIPLSNMLGAPVSARIMRMNGHGGLAGWQWLFLLEAIPAVVLGCLVPWLLQPEPQLATWLSAEEKATLLAAMEPVETVASDTSAWSQLPMLTAPAIIYFAMMVGLYGLGFWVPRLLANQGVGLVNLGWLTAAPYAAGATGMLLLSRLSDATGRRRLILTLALVCAGCGMAATGIASSALAAIVTLSVAAVGVFASMPVFWAAITQKMPAAHVAVGIAAINSVGNLGGFVGASATGWLLKRTHSYMDGLLATGLCLFCGALLAVWSMARRPKPLVEVAS